MILYILVVTYNAERWVPIFAPAFKSLPEKWKVMVVDNASSDRTLEILQRDYPHFHLIKNNKNLGFGAANNLAMKLALQDEADYVFLLNQDACITIEDLRRLIDEHQKHPECLVTSPLQYNLDFIELHAAFASFCHPDFTPGILGDALEGKLKRIYYTRMVSAAAWLISNKCLKTVGGFNPIFFLYSEDVDYVNRVLYHGYKVGIVTAAKIGHCEGKRNNRPDRKLMERLSEYSNPDLNKGIKNVLVEFIKLFFRTLWRRQFFTARQVASHMIKAYKDGFLSKKNQDKIKAKGPIFLE